MKNLWKMKMTNLTADFKLISPEAEILNKPLPIFEDKILPEGFTRTKVAEDLFVAMKQFGGIGLSANQVGLPYRMFVMGGHQDMEEGKARACWNPEIIEFSEETIQLSEGCLTYPLLFLQVTRPKKIKVKYTDNDGKEWTEDLDHMPSRVFQHEFDHMNGTDFTKLVSKFKLDRAKEKLRKLYEQEKKLAPKTVQLAKKIKKEIEEKKTGVIKPNTDIIV